MFTYCRTHELTIEPDWSLCHRGKSRFFSAEARSSGDLRGKQRVDQAAQLIGLMTDDALMTAACDLPLCVPGLYVTVAASDNKGKVASIGF